MVEIHEQSKDAKKLRDRIQTLTKELDQAESRHRESEKAFREVLSVLAGLAGPHLDKRQGKKLKKTKKAFEAEKPDPEAMHAAVADLKDTLLNGTEPGKAKAGTGGEDDVSRHVALALLEGLRLGDAEFDAGLEGDIVEIQRLIRENQVRPAMVLTMDLMDRFRHALEKRIREAEVAFKEVVSEVFKTEEAFTETVHEAQDGIMRVTREFDDQVTASMGGLAKALKESTSLESMKARAVEHLRSLREGIKARQEKEQGMLSATRRQLEQVRSNLGNLRERVRQAEQMSERMSEEALTDPLTKIWNKRAFSQRLAEALDDSGHAPVCLIIFDIDNFKGVNDNYGHQAGDKALQAIADRASNALRRSDALFRYAGDEFAVILVQTPLEAAMEAAERIRQSTETIKFTYRGQGELHITVTLGVAQAKKGESLSSLFERADQALFEAKRKGRNRVGRA